MGAVYEAVDERLGHTIALKQMTVAGSHFVTAFEREARLLARLRHPSLPKVMDHFPDPAGHFLIMEFIPGTDLLEVLHQRSQPFPVAEVLPWAEHILAALEYLHRQQIIHRDIKPQNMKLTATEEIVLLDFGLAKHVLSGSVQAFTPQYAPLEQIQGTGTDPRSDLYSLAATLYHLLTGSSPEDALTRASTVAYQQPDPLRPAHQVNPAVPVAVSKVLTRGLAIHAKDRFASAAEMRAALRQATSRPPQAVQTGKTVTQQPAPKTRKQSPKKPALVWVSGLLLLVLLVVGGAGGAWWMQQNGGEEALDEPGVVGLADATSTTTAEPTATDTPELADTTTATAEPTSTVTATIVTDPTEADAFPTNITVIKPEVTPTLATVTPQSFREGETLSHPECGTMARRRSEEEDHGTDG
jgi:serine/threonine protein kinase